MSNIEVGQIRNYYRKTVEGVPSTPMRVLEVTETAISAPGPQGRGPGGGTEKRKPAGEAG